MKINVDKFRLSTDYWGYNGIEVPHNKNVIKWRETVRHARVHNITKQTTSRSIKIADLYVVINSRK